jgi:hypothetical protein
MVRQQTKRYAHTRRYNFAYIEKYGVLTMSMTCFICHLTGPRQRPRFMSHADNRNTSRVMS